MKKNVFFIVAFTFLSATAFSQGTSFGIKAGVNIANQKFSESGFSVSPSSLVGFHGGVYLTAMFSEHIGLQPEILYSAQGSKFDGGSTLKFNYISIPVLFRYNVNELISFHAGPQLGILASAKSDDTDIKDSVKSTDLGVAFGGTVDLPMGLNFTLRYIAGISDIEDSGSDTTIKNNNLQISVGYKLFGGQ